MRIYHISDTHGFHRELPIIEADLVIHSGDVSNTIDPAMNTNEVLDFLNWFEELKIPNKVFVPGNHDCSIWHGYVAKESIEERGIKMLINESYSLDGLKMWGSPYTPKLFDHYNHWAWGLERKDMDKVWRMIPDDLDILITHGPPRGILDLSIDHKDRKSVAQCGDGALYSQVQEKRPSFHMFGHIHDEKTFNNFGVFQRGFTKYSNGACAGRSKLQLCNGGNIFII